MEKNILFCDSINKKRLKDIRYKKFENYIKYNNLDNLIYRIVLEHDKEYRENCYLNGFDPYPNNKLKFILNYICDNYKPTTIKELKNETNINTFKFGNYFFIIPKFKGDYIKIYNKDDFRLILKL